MRRELPLPHELWEQIPPLVQAALALVGAGDEQRIGRLEAEVAELKARLGQTSQNSSQPPSSDGPHGKRTPPGRHRGATAGASRGILSINERYCRWKKSMK